MWRHQHGINNGERNGVSKRNESVKRKHGSIVASGIGSSGEIGGHHQAAASQ